MTSITAGHHPDGALVLPGQDSLFTDAQTEALRPGSTRPWNPAAIARSGADPMLAVRVCQAILRSALDEDAAGYDPDGLDSPVIAQLLTLATAHRPVLYVSEACAEGDCETPPESPGAGCGCPGAAAGCGACTPHAGLWAGEWEGTPLPGLLVPAPCSVLTVLAARYDIPVRYPWPGSSAPAN